MVWKEKAARPQEMSSASAFHFHISPVAAAAREGGALPHLMRPASRLLQHANDAPRGTGSLRAATGGGTGEEAP